jgi:hypothetical protein
MISISNKNIIIILASLLIVISVVLALIQQNSDKPTDYEVEIKDLQTQSTSDAVNAIEEDLLDTNLENIDSELLDIEKELEQEF